MTVRSNERQDQLALLRAVDPIAPTTEAAPALDAALDEIAQAIVQQRRAPRRRMSAPRARVALLAAVVALVIGGGVAAGAGLFSAHTGTYPTKTEAGMGGPGEALNPAAPDFREVALQVASDIPYPAGYESWRDFLISDEIRTDAGSGLVSTGALHGWFAASAYCAWVRNWRDADLAGDAAGTARAAQFVSAAPGWKAVTEEDPHPSPSVPGDGGFTHYTLFGWMLPYRDAVLAGDRTRLDGLLANGYGDKCWTSDPGWRRQLALHRDDWAGLSQTALAENYEQFLAGGGS